MMRTTSSHEVIDAQAFRRQQTAFCVLTLFVISVLLLLHTLFASLLGEPSKAVIVVLGLSFSLKVLEFGWLQAQAGGISEKTARWETALSIVGIFILAELLVFLTNRDDAPYFVLLAIPILQSAYHFGLGPTILTISASIGMIFLWMRHYFALHPPALATEYMEAGMISVIYCLMGLLVWFLVRQLKQQQAKLYESMEELESTREKLIVEENLGAVGRLATGIAHEIRNPVAMISSSLATAANPEVGDADREEMVQIAAREANRLEHLTTEFLSYARPAAPQRSVILVNDLLSHTANAVKAYAASKAVEVICSFAEETAVEVDSAQVQGALLNLVLNGIDASFSPGAIALDVSRNAGLIQINVQNTGNPISDSDLPRIFEPFYSTKPTGTGLGLAIARRVAQIHGGDVWISSNQQGRVVFSMTLSVSRGQRAEEGQ